MRLLLIPLELRACCPRMGGAAGPADRVPVCPSFHWPPPVCAGVCVAVGVFATAPPLPEAPPHVLGPVWGHTAQKKIITAAPTQWAHNTCAHGPAMGVARDTLVCKSCGEGEPAAFTRSSAARRVCKACLNKSKRKHRHSDPARAIMTRVSARGEGALFKIADARAVLAAFDHRSALCGSPHDLTIVKQDRALPLTRSNAVVVTVRQALLQPK